MRHQLLGGLVAASFMGLAVPALAAAPANFRCGGIGIDESQQMKAEARSHDLVLTFASSTGAYVADVEVAIRTARGEEVLATRCDGPIMLVDLPRDGTYRVTASFRGESRQRTVSVRDGRTASGTFVWPAG